MMAGKIGTVILLVHAFSISSVDVVEVPREQGSLARPHYSGSGVSVRNFEVMSQYKTPQKLVKTAWDDRFYPDPRKHPCNRKCFENEMMTCRYKFKAEYYQTMSKACYNCPFNMTDCYRKDCIPGNGVKRQVMVINRQLPGPMIQVCLGDIVQVEVKPEIFEETTTIHWHGQHQRGSQFMDGVPHLTQCPILPKTTFVYRFNASTPGTHFWHSHSGFQRGDGLFGSFIVRLPLSKEKLSHLYDYDLAEHVIQVIDWNHKAGLWQYISHHHSSGDNKPDSILVNGKGRFQKFQDQNQVLFTPAEKFSVVQGYRYRFRLINSGSLNCPVEVSVDNHTVLIVGSDGADLQPVEAKSFVCYAGERFDFIVDMNQEIGNYWMRFRGLMDCDERYNSAFQLAILHYKGADEDADPEGRATYDVAPKGLQVNSLNTGLNKKNSLILPELRAARSDAKDPRLKPIPDYKFFIAYDFYPLDNTHFHVPYAYGFNQVKENERVYTPQLNHISMVFPPFPLLGNMKDFHKVKTCNSSTIPKACRYKYCECTHLLRVSMNAVVELILIDEGVPYDANHPFHLHGYNFRVIGMDRLGQNVTEEFVRYLDAKGHLMRNLEDAPIKDTVTVPDGGYTIVRWHATNPGYWLLHCHIQYHMEIGMALVFKVGEDSDYPPLPKHFPRCNSFYPNDEDEDAEERNTCLVQENNKGEVLPSVVESYLKISSQTASLNNSCSENFPLLIQFISLCMNILIVFSL